MKRNSILIDKILLRGINTSDKSDIDVRKLCFVSVFILLGLVASISSLLLGLVVQNANFNLLAPIFAAGGFFTLYLLFRLTQRFELVIQAILVGLNVLCIYLLINDNFDTAIMWCFTHGVVAGLTLNWRRAISWSLLYLASILVVLTSPGLNGGDSHSIVYLVIFVISYVSLMSFAMSYQRIVAASERTIQENKNQLTALNERLQQELAFATKSKKDLDTLSVSLAQQNKKLVRSRSALVNLLEDAKELEQQLKAAKADVERKVIERTQELSLEQARLDSTIQSLPMAVMLLSSDMKIVDANYIAKTIAGVSRTDIVSSKLSQKDSTALLRLLNYFASKTKLKQQVKKGEEYVIPEVQYKGAYYKLVASPIHRFSGESTNESGAVIVIEDMTEQRLLDRAKDEFLMIASHELRTPLTAIRGDAVILKKMLAKKHKDSDLNEMVRDIETSSARLLGIVNDYLELSSLEQNQLIIKPKLFNLANSVTRIIHENSSIADAKNLTLRTDKDYGKQQYTVMADEDRIMQVLQNLVSNAIHYTEKGRVQISLATAKDRVVCRVSDTGIGIAKSSQARLFSKFEQAQDNLLTRDPARSTGLGLYIAKLIIEKSGGEIAIESSTLKKGSVFMFSLPLAIKKKSATVKRRVTNRSVAGSGDALRLK